MKLTSSITTIVTSIEYDSEQDCYYACTSDAIPCRKWIGPAIGMVDGTVYRVYLEFGDYQNLEDGDTIRVDRYEHLKGECFGDYTFISNGIHNVVTKL